MGSSYPTTTPPGRFGRPRRNGMGHAHRLCRSRRDRAGTRDMLIPTQWRDPGQAGITVHIRLPTPRRRHMLLRCK